MSRLTSRRTDARLGVVSARLRSTSASGRSRSSKSIAWRVVTDGEPIGIRADSELNVPEPEVAVVAPEGAEVVGTFADGDLAGSAAVLRNSYGQGSVWYLATRLDDTGMRTVMDAVTRAAGVVPVLPQLPAGVEGVRGTSSDGATTLVLLNHRGDPVTVPLPATATRAAAEIVLEPRGVALLRLAPEAIPQTSTQDRSDGAGSVDTERKHHGNQA